MHSEVRPKFRIEFPEGADLVDRISQIFKENGNPKSREHLAWQYLANPGGGCYSAFAVSEDGKDAAVYSLFKVKAKFQGEITTVCQSLDTLTDSGFRGMGLFTLLAKAVNSRCDDDEIAFIYGFPNDKSGPGFFRKLGWLSMGSPPFVFYANNCLFFLSWILKKKLFLKNYVAFLYHWLISRLIRIRYRYQVRFDESFHEQYDDLWRSFSDAVDTCIWRNYEYLKWRYIDKPGADYRFISIWRDSHLVGLSIYTQREKHNGNVGYVMDVIFRKGDDAAGKLALAQSLLDLSRTKADVVLAWRSSLLAVGRCYRFALFVSLPRFAQPIKLFFGWRPQLGGGAAAEIVKQQFYVSYADSDTV